VAVLKSKTVKAAFDKAPNKYMKQLAADEAKLKSKFIGGQ
jgi:hypothetical protein